MSAMPSDENADERDGHLAELMMMTAVAVGLGSRHHLRHHVNHALDRSPQRLYRRVYTVRPLSR